MRALNIMVEVCNGHSHAKLCHINCCSNLGVDTICYTDLVQNLTIVDQWRVDKNSQNTTLRHQDLVKHHIKVCAVIWDQKLSKQTSTSVLEINQKPRYYQYTKDSYTSSECPLTGL